MVASRRKHKIGKDVWLIGRLQKLSVSLAASWPAVCDLDSSPFLSFVGLGVKVLQRKVVSSVKTKTSNQIAVARFRLHLDRLFERLRFGDLFWRVIVFDIHYLTKSLCNLSANGCCDFVDSRSEMPWSLFPNIVGDLSQISQLLWIDLDLKHLRSSTRKASIPKRDTALESAR